MDKKLELLSPAGDMERLRMSVAYGADAVYLAGQQYGMRSFAGNFSREELREAVALCRAHGVAVHVTCNTMPRSGELEGLPEYLEYLQDIGVTAAIIGDIGVLALAKRHAPRLKLHISTQASVTNYQAARAWHDLGAGRVILARELTLDEVAEIRAKTPSTLELEAFVHGAMCVSYSGRCVLSNYMTGRDAGRGACAQPCRYKYAVVEEKRPGEFFPVEEDDRGTYLFNSKDMCMIDHVPELLAAGLDSLKIEGRAKTFYYVASVTAAYRRALDAYLADPLNDNFELPAEVYEELTRTSHRHYSPGFYFGREQARQATDSATYIREWEFVGTVDGWENGVASCQQRGKWSLGDTLEALCPDGRSIPLNPEWIENEAGERVESTPHAMEKYTIPTPELPPMSLLRRKTV